MEQRLMTLHALNRAVDDAFREAGIVIAFPQLDVHINPSDAKDDPDK
jgi:potassium efflux system protein